MALTLLTEPTPTSPPSSANDWGYLNTKVTALVQAFTGRNPVVGSTIKAGTVIPVGGALYKATVDESITGTASIYVKITPAGSTATASFVSSLSGVSWNHVYGQYLDGSGNAYLFDEARAINEGVLSTAYTMQGQIAYIKGGLDLNGPLTGVQGISMGGSALTAVGLIQLSGGEIAGATDISMDGNITGAKDISMNGSLTGVDNLPMIPGSSTFLPVHGVASGYSYEFPVGQIWASFIFVPSAGICRTGVWGAGILELWISSGIVEYFGFIWRIR